MKEFRKPSVGFRNKILGEKSEHFSCPVWFSADMSSLTANATNEVDTQRREVFDHDLSFLKSQSQTKAEASWLVDAVGRPLVSTNYTSSEVSQEPSYVLS